MNKINTILLLIFVSCSLPTITIAQFGAEYSSYGFNFVNDTNNDGWHGWQSDDLGNTAKLDIYKQSPTLNNYALELKAQNDTVQMAYNDSGYMDLNTCSFVINLRLNLTQYTGNQDGITFRLYTGAKLIDIQFKNTGIYYVDGSNNSTYITAAPTANQWFTYTISLDGCAAIGDLMIENDDVNSFPLTFPNNTQSPSIELYNYTDGNTVFETEIDHLFIYSNPTKWWLGSATPYVDESNVAGTTGDRQHYLNLANGERIGVNENAGGYVTFTELYPGGDNLDPNPKFGSGGTKTLRNYFHSSDYNPVQPGAASTTGGHLVTVNATANQLEIEPFPLHLYYKSGVTENNPLVFPNGEIMENSDNVTTDHDVYDEFGLDMRHELITEMDFSSTLENHVPVNGISVVKHRGEWEYIRHSCQVLQYHDPASSTRYTLNGSSPQSDVDMGQMRHKFEFRLNKDLGYEWVLWQKNGQWDSLHLTTEGQSKSYTYTTAIAALPLESRFMVFSTSSSLNDPNAVAWYYPETPYNANCTVQKSRTDKSTVSQEDRRYQMRITSDWRKTNWCRMNLYVWNEGLLAPQNGDPNTYESFQMEAYQLFGTPSEIWTAIQAVVLPIELAKFEVEKTAENQVAIQWETSTETNNNYFTVERSTDGETWETFKKINGAGTAIESKYYSTIDKNPLQGTSFYRLKQTDFDGTATTSETKSIHIDKIEDAEINVFPNPTNGILNIQLNGMSIKKIVLVDNLGKDLTDNIRYLSTSEEQVVLDFSQLSHGLYYLVLDNNLVYKIQKN